MRWFKVRINMPFSPLHPPPHEPHVGTPASGTAWRGIAHSKWPCRRPALRFRGAKRVRRTENSHLDPLPSPDEGRGNPAVSVQRTPVSVCERDAPFPLPFRRGEDQGEGLLRKTFVSLNEWACILALSHGCRETFARSHRMDSKLTRKERGQPCPRVHPKC